MPSHYPFMDSPKFCKYNIIEMSRYIHMECCSIKGGQIYTWYEYLVFRSVYFPYIVILLSIMMSKMVTRKPTLPGAF